MEFRAFAFLASSGLRSGPGITTSVKRRSILTPLSSTGTALAASLAVSML